MLGKVCSEIRDPILFSASPYARNDCSDASTDEKSELSQDWKKLVEWFTVSLRLVGVTESNKVMIS